MVARRARRHHEGAIGAATHRNGARSTSVCLLFASIVYAIFKPLYRRKLDAEQAKVSIFEKQIEQLKHEIATSDERRVELKADLERRNAETAEQVDQYKEMLRMLKENVSRRFVTRGNCRRYSGKTPSARSRKAASPSGRDRDKIESKMVL